MDVQVVLEGNKSDERVMKLFELLVTVMAELNFEHDDESEKCLASKNKVNQDSSFMYQ